MAISLVVVAPDEAFSFGSEVAGGVEEEPKEELPSETEEGALEGAEAAGGAAGAAAAAGASSFSQILNNLIIFL